MNAGLDLIKPATLATGNDDGGLALRMQLRAVKTEMGSALFRKSKVMSCGACRALNLVSVRRFRTWDALRSHLVTYHRIDHREVPE